MSIARYKGVRAIAGGGKDGGSESAARTVHRDDRGLALPEGSGSCFEVGKYSRRSAEIVEAGEFGQVVCRLQIVVSTLICEQFGLPTFVAGGMKRCFFKTNMAGDGSA